MGAITVTLAVILLGFACASSARVDLAADDAALDIPLMMREPRTGSIVRIAPTDASLYFSPYQWSINALNATTVNTASYVRFMCSGTFVNFTFDVSMMVPEISEVYWRVDNGPATHSLVLPIVSITIPVNNTHGDVPYHNVELFVKSMTETANRWLTGVPSTRVVMTGIVTDGVTAPWLPSDVNILIYGDSITEGVLTLGGSQKFDTDHDDASVVYSYTLARLLGTEIGVVGFGATGLSRGGSGNVPPLGVSWNQLWDGVPRSFSPRPDLIIFNEGTNDQTANITAKMTVVLNNLLGACPATPIAVLLPFNGAEKSNLQAAIAASNSPALITFIDTAGFYNQTYGGALHPTGPNDVAQIAPQIAKVLRPILARSIIAREERRLA